MLWALCVMLGFMTVSFAPFIMGTAVSILTGVGRKFPALSDAVATITVILVGAALIAMGIIFAIVYHHLITGSP